MRDFAVCPRGDAVGFGRCENKVQAKYLSSKYVIIIVQWTCVVRNFDTSNLILRAKVFSGPVQSYLISYRSKSSDKWRQASLQMSPTGLLRARVYCKAKYRLFNAGFGSGGARSRGRRESVQRKHCRICHAFIPSQSKLTGVTCNMLFALHKSTTSFLCYSSDASL